MQATYIQKLIRLNASAIAHKEGVVELYLEDAKAEAAAGNKSLAIAEYKQADKQRRALAKLVDIQRVMKAELATIHRLARIDRKIKLLKSHIANFAATGDDLTSREFELALDQIIDFVVPKKPDSRQPQA